MQQQNQAQEATEQKKHFTREEYRELLRRASQIRTDNEERLSGAQLAEIAAEVGVREADLREAERQMLAEQERVQWRRRVARVVAGITAFALALSLIFSFNSLNSARARVIEARANVASVLQSRADLADTLLAVLHSRDGSMRGEQSVLQSAREALKSPDPGSVETARDRLDQLLENLHRRAATQDPNVLNTYLSEMTGTANRLTEYRRRANRAIADYNRTAGSFPNRLFRPLLGFPKEIPAE